MKTGKSLTELAQELERQQNAKRDFQLRSDAITLKTDSRVGNLPVAEISEVGTFGINPTFHAQASAALGIPKKYYDRMLETSPDLLVENVNHWLKKEPRRNLVRTLDGSMRALLSDRFRTLDNFDLAEAVIPTLIQNQCEVKSSELTERRMYIQAVLPSMQAAVKVGDIVQAGVTISNSEIGEGSLRVEPMVYRLVCSNGMIGSRSLRKYHVGRAAGIEDQVREMLSDTTKRKVDQAFWLQVRDVVKASFDQTHFQLLVDKFKEASDCPITGDPVKVVEVTAKHFEMTDGERGSVLRNLIKDGDLSKWGMLNAVTAVAHDSEDYDRSVELERMGGKVLELSDAVWEDISATE